MIGISIDARAGNVDITLADHGLPDRPPLVMQASQEAVRLVMMGRIYYQRDVRTGLGFAQTDLLEIAVGGDAALALAVYKRHGLEGLQRLEGDFSIVVLDGDKRCLIAMRDPMGGFPLFYKLEAGRIRISTGMEPLLAEGGVDLLDPEYLAEYLVGLGCVPQDKAGRSVFCGIQRVPPGCVLVAGLADDSIRSHRYWNWLDRVVDPGTDDTACLGEQFRELFQAAVRERMRGLTASHLSGGMDSTAVALVARNVLEGRERLHTLSVVYQRFPRLARERPYLDRVLEEAGLDPVLLVGDDALDFDNLEAAANHDEPSSGLVRMCAAVQAMTEAASRQGVATILTGFGADDLFLMQPFHLADLLRTGKVFSAWREASAWGQAMSSNVWAVLGPFGLYPVLPALSRMGVRNWLLGGFAPWPANTEWTIPPWIRPDYARRMDLRGRILTNIRRSRHAGQPAGVSLLLNSFEMYQDDYSRMSVAAPRGMMIAHPFLDPRICAWGLGTRMRIRPRPGGQKPVLAAAMRGIVPDSILDRPSKGNFNEAYFAGLSRNLASLERLIEDAPGEDLGFLDKSMLLNCLQQTALGNSGDAGVLLQLNATLSLVLWLTLRRRGT